MKKTTRVLVFLAVLTLTLSTSLSAFAAPGKTNHGSGNSAGTGNLHAQVTVQPVNALARTAKPATWAAPRQGHHLNWRMLDRKDGRIPATIQGFPGQMNLKLATDPNKQALIITVDQAHELFNYLADMFGQAIPPDSSTDTDSGTGPDIGTDTDTSASGDENASVAS